ncbi:fungal-specific transcription factor domain-containing protein [Ilyonectria robusta]|uniref:fungal-specific transcription factor domain-containing protein n=1 Tax=Ilyonectria robusta TaxID=1079257 RepID=UPI001E8E2545|nr:fungal-specific transcription factor domain-containing protein [Ilyonectria robusta]KAH8688540.1 fungal-specific transcription factor domain-containing protein [Ilyonectria robusta]
MFHSFESQIPTHPAPASSGRSSGPSRKVNKSCLECTRRKVKCDGGYPCSSCQHYHVSEACVYTHRNRRQAASKSALEKATDTVRRQAEVLQRLFPGYSLDDLLAKNRSELIGLLSPSATDDRSLQTPIWPISTSVSPVVSGDLEDAHDSPDESETGESGEERHWEEPAQNPATIAASDDINAISLAGDRHRRSYLGITSVSAVLRVLFRLCPAAKKRTMEESKTWPDVQQNDPRPSVMKPALGIAPSSDSLREQRYVGFYFEHVHSITPLIHEESFRATFAAADRQTPAWQGLCNMVLTLGSIASGSDTAHIHYYNQARSFIDLDSLGSGNLESLQALCLLGGYYLHYRNSPNMAYAILGAAQRLAIALGLHRESPVRNDYQDPDTAQRSGIRIETRRRTWWSLYCLDTWASMTLGRPTCGRWDSTTMNTLLPNALNTDDHFAISLRASCQFCHICNRLQHRFAQSTRLNTAEAQAFDLELQQWHEALPLILKDTINPPPRITVASEFLRNRYYNVRLMLSRCFLLYLAYEDLNGQIPSQAEVQMADLCRAIAADAIDAIAVHWVPNRIQVWNSAWYLFQACMVPLLSISMKTSSSPGGMQADSVVSWNKSLNKALEVFAEMKPWMRTSDRSPDIVAVLFQAVSEGAEGAVHTPSVTDGGSLLFGLGNEQLTEMDWSMFFSEESISYSLF